MIEQQVRQLDVTLQCPLTVRIVQRVGSLQTNPRHALFLVQQHLARQNLNRHTAPQRFLLRLEDHADAATPNPPG